MKFPPSFGQGNLLWKVTDRHWTSTSIQWAGNSSLWISFWTDCYFFFLFVDGEWLCCPDDGTSTRLSSLLRLSSSLKLLNFHFLKLLHRHVKARGWRQTIHDVWVLERMKGRHPNKPNHQVFSITNVPMDHSDAGMPYIKLPFWGWNNATNWFCFYGFRNLQLPWFTLPYLEQILITYN